MRLALSSYRAVLAILAMLSCARTAEAASRYSPTAQPEKVRLLGKPYVAQGLGSAHFGMTPDQVREAASRDFGVPPGKLTSGAADASTFTLAMEVSSLPPVGRTGLVSYVFDASTKTLNAINMVWVAERPEGKDVLIRGATAAAANFLGYSWKLFSAARGVPLDPSTLIVFAATAENGGGVEVRLQGVPYELQSDGATPKLVGDSEGQGRLRIGLVQHTQAPDIRTLIQQRTATAAPQDTAK